MNCIGHRVLPECDVASPTHGASWVYLSAVWLMWIVPAKLCPSPSPGTAGDSFPSPTLARVLARGVDWLLPPHLIL